MKIIVNDLRPLHAIPSRLYAEITKQNIKFTGLEIIDISKFKNSNNWWEYEKYLVAVFGEPVKKDINNYCLPNCPANCCYLKDIRIFASTSELDDILQSSTFDKAEVIDGEIMSEGEKFYILKAKEDNSCIFLKDNGCSINKDKPLWCKMWVCDKYMFPKIKTG
jgi:hypothetical protein